MGYEQPGFRVSHPADVDMSVEATWQYAGVWVGPAVNIVGQGVGGLALQAKGSNTAPCYGVLQHNPVQGEAGDVVQQGITKCQYGGTVTAGAPFMFNAAGQAVTATSTNYISGYILESGVVGDVGTVNLIPHGKL